MWQRFTERARRVILLGQEEASKMNSSHVGTEHLLLGLVRENEGVAAQVLQKMGVSLQRVRQEIEAEVEPSEEGASSEPKLTPRAKRVLELAADEARRMRHNYIGTEHLLLALLREKDGVAASVLRKLGLNLERARNQVMEYLGPEAPQPEKQGGERGTGGGAPTGGGRTGRSQTPALDQFGRDINQLALEGKLDPVIGRQAQIDRTIQILCRRTKNNPVFPDRHRRGPGAAHRGARRAGAAAR